MADRLVDHATSVLVDVRGLVDRVETVGRLRAAKGKRLSPQTGRLVAAVADELGRLRAALSRFEEP